MPIDPNDTTIRVKVDGGLVEASKFYCGQRLRVSASDKNAAIKLLVKLSVKVDQE